ncbi:MAG TPA: diaminopimelate decarboxylase [Acidimicrobiia bacterium]|nr:diaminopimelate decarboxylase [Acidimicrobiia bacterium]
MTTASAAPLDLALLPSRATVDASGRLSLAGVDLTSLADAHGTPLYVYDEDELRDRCRSYLAAFGQDASSDGAGGHAGASYAAKAFLCVAMARLVHEEGLDLDVASGGEAHVAHRAGFPPSRMVFHGNNKSELELRLALTLPVGRLVIDGFDELDRVEALVADGLPRPRVLLRVTPGIEAHTHEHILTGAEDSKFGFSVSNGAAREAALRATASAAVDLVGFHCHIGSQILVLDAYTRAAQVMAALAADVRAATGQLVEELNLGGGLGVAYTESDLLGLPSIADFAAVVTDAHVAACAAAGLDPAPRLTVEAGRSIAAPAGLTLYRVGTVKAIPGVRTYVAVDGGMSDNPRPITYGARYEAFLPARVASERPLTATIAGKHCEQGDLLVRDAQLPADVAVGDVLATPVTGAYAHSMASNYNQLPRPAVVFVRDGEARVVVRRETFDDLLRLDVE